MLEAQTESPTTQAHSSAEGGDRQDRCVRGNSFELVTRESSVSLRSSALPSDCFGWQKAEGRMIQEPQAKPQDAVRVCVPVGTGSCPPMVPATGQLT